MWRFLAGVASAMLFMTAGILVWRSNADAVQTALPSAPAADEAMTFADVSPPLEASEKTREQKRFSRYDKDKNGAVSRGEYLISRQKAYVRLDTNGDGKLSFEEYAFKTVAKFAKADRDRTGALTAAEFMATRVVRKTAKAKCPPPSRLQQAPASAASSDDEDV
jgi:uncharacterized protein YxeA